MGFFFLYCMYLHNLAICSFVQWWRQMCLSVMVVGSVVGCSNSSHWHSSNMQVLCKCFWLDKRQESPRFHSNLACKWKAFSVAPLWLFFSSCLNLSLSSEVHCASQVFSSSFYPFQTPELLQNTRHSWPFTHIFPKRPSKLLLFLMCTWQNIVYFSY